MKDENKSCYFCKNRKSYFGFPYCIKNPKHVVLLMSYPPPSVMAKCFEEIDYRHNWTHKPTAQEKEAIQQLKWTPDNCETCEHFHLESDYCCSLSLYRKEIKKDFKKCPFPLKKEEDEND